MYGLCYRTNASEPLTWFTENNKFRVVNAPSAMDIDWILGGETTTIQFTIPNYEAPQPGGVDQVSFSQIGEDCNAHLGRDDLTGAGDNFNVPVGATDRADHPGRYYACFHAEETTAGAGVVTVPLDYLGLTVAGVTAVRPAVVMDGVPTRITLEGVGLDENTEISIEDDGACPASGAGANTTPLKREDVRAVYSATLTRGTNAEKNVCIKSPSSGDYFRVPPAGPPHITVRSLVDIGPKEVLDGQTQIFEVLTPDVTTLQPGDAVAFVKDYSVVGDCSEPWVKYYRLDTSLQTGAIDLSAMNGTGTYGVCYRTQVGGSAVGYSGSVNDVTVTETTVPPSIVGTAEQGNAATVEFPDLSLYTRVGIVPPATTSFADPCPTITTYVNLDNLLGTLGTPCAPNCRERFTMRWAGEGFRFCAFTDPGTAPAPAAPDASKASLLFGNITVDGLESISPTLIDPGTDTLSVTATGSTQIRITNHTDCTDGPPPPADTPVDDETAFPISTTSLVDSFYRVCARITGGTYQDTGIRILTYAALPTGLTSIPTNYMMGVASDPSDPPPSPSPAPAPVTLGSVYRQQMDGANYYVIAPSHLKERFIAVRRNGGNSDWWELSILKPQSWPVYVGGTAVTNPSQEGLVKDQLAEPRFRGGSFPAVLDDSYYRGPTSGCGGLATMICKIRHLHMSVDGILYALDEHRALRFADHPVTEHGSRGFEYGNATQTFGDIDAAGSTKATLNAPRGMSASSTHVFVADTNNHRVVVLRASNLTYVTQYGSTGRALATDYGFEEPWDTQYINAPEPCLYVTDRENARIMEFKVKNLSPDGRGEIITWRHMTDTDCPDALGGPANSRTTDIYELPVSPPPGGVDSYVTVDQCKSACHHNPLCDCFSYTKTVTCPGGTPCADYYKGTCMLKQGCWDTDNDCPNQGTVTGIDMYFIERPGSLAYEGQKNVGNRPLQLAWSYPYLFVLKNNREIRVMDVSNGLGPSTVSVLVTVPGGGFGTNLYGFFVHGPYLVLSCTQGGNEYIMTIPFTHTITPDTVSFAFGGNLDSDKDVAGVVRVVEGRDATLTLSSVEGLEVFPRSGQNMNYVTLRGKLNFVNAALDSVRVENFKEDRYVIEASITSDDGVLPGAYASARTTIAVGTKRLLGTADCPIHDSLVCGGRGECHPVTQTCVCAHPYTGGNCSETQCVPTCQNGGICDLNTGTCTCTGSFSGAACEELACPVAPVSGLVCNGAGTCNTTTGVCMCEYPHFGEMCQYTSCPTAEVMAYGIAATECALHGRCDIRNDTIAECVCDVGWYGSGCNHAMCVHGRRQQFQMETGVIPVRGGSIEAGTVDAFECGLARASRCDPLTGECLCSDLPPGGSGSRACTYHECTSVGADFAGQETGTDCGWSNTDGGSYCDFTSGRCMCQPEVSINGGGFGWNCSQT